MGKDWPGLVIRADSFSNFQSYVSRKDPFTREFMPESYNHMKA